LLRLNILFQADVLEILPEAASDSQNVLLYFYYGALILLATKVRAFAPKLFHKDLKSFSF